MIRSLLFVICILPYLLSPLVSTAAAVGDGFTISSFVGEDLNPPTTPVLQTAIPVAPTQINLTWLPSTDDVVLLGYRVYRDGLPIATTTLTTFSDTGLAASTTYSYTVDAYDSYDNVSSSSAPLATTTFALPPPPATTTATTTSSGGGATAVPTLRSLVVTPDRTAAIIDWQTYGPTRYTLAWGRTTSYEIGTVSSNVFSQQHQTTLVDLEPGTRYFFQLLATDGRGVTRQLASDSFTTRPQVSTDIPINVQFFTGTVRGTDVTLHWKNPPLPSGAVVRIVRSHFFYPQSIQDGALVYEGLTETVTDREALTNRSPQYYTAFVITAEGLVSSGAIVRMDKELAGEVVVPGSESLPEPEYQESGDETILRAADIILAQGNTMQHMDAVVVLSASGEVFVRIPLKAVARNLKTIIVSLENPTDQRQVSSYLLKLNQGGDAYEAVIPPTRVAGQARLTIEVFDYTQETVRRISTIVTFTGEASETARASYVSTDWWLVVAGVSVLSVLLWWFILLKRRRARDEDNR